MPTRRDPATGLPLYSERELGLDRNLTGGGTAACPAPSATCADNDGDNDTEYTATQLGSLDDPDIDGRIRCGVLSHRDDVDWYSYHGNDTPNGYVDPTRAWSGVPNVRICAYFQCDQPPKLADCPEGTTPDTSPGGIAGCCGDDIGSARNRKNLGRKA